MKAQANKEGRAWSWKAQGVAGVECFCARAITHHYGRHSHDAYAIGVIDAGVGGLHYRGGTDYIPAGAIVVLNPGEPHTGYAASGQPLSYRMLYVAVEAFREVLPEGAPLPHFRDLRIQSIYWAERLTFLHGSLAAGTDALKQQDCAQAVLANFARAYGENKEADSAGREPLAVGRIKEFLRANYRRNVSIDELTQLTRLSRAYLIRAFRRAVGVPPYSWLLQVRLEEAKRLLAQGMPIAEVAGEVGFTDQSHLTRHFKSVTGLTPGQYAAGHYRSRLDSVPLLTLPA